MGAAAFARLFFHRPSFVVLDECTNGISPDVERAIYDRSHSFHPHTCALTHARAHTRKTHCVVCVCVWCVVWAA